MLGGDDGVGTRTREYGGEIHGAVVPVVTWLQQGRATGGDRAPQRHPIGNAARRGGGACRGGKRAGEVAPGHAVDRLPANGAAGRVKLAGRGDGSVGDDP